MPNHHSSKKFTLSMFLILGFLMIQGDAEGYFSKIRTPGTWVPVEYAKLKIDRQKGSYDVTYKKTPDIILTRLIKAKIPFNRPYMAGETGIPTRFKLTVDGVTDLYLVKDKTKDACGSLIYSLIREIETRADMDISITLELMDNRSRRCKDRRTSWEVTQEKRYLGKFKGMRELSGWPKPIPSLPICRSRLPGRTCPIKKGNP